MHTLAATTATPTFISTVNYGLVVYMAAEIDTAEDHEVENALKDHERSYERKIESLFQSLASNYTTLLSMMAFVFLNLD